MGRFRLKLQKICVEAYIFWLEERLHYRREIVEDYDRSFAKHREYLAVGIDNLTPRQREKFNKLHPAITNHQTKADYETHRQIVLRLERSLRRAKLCLA